MVVPLAGLSVVDAGDDATALLGRMLSDLGATVRLVGPKDPIGEALNDVDSYRGAFAVGKSTLERVELLRACHDADVVLAGNLAKFPELGAASDWPSRFPGTILVSITPFGTSGPMSHRASSDLVNMAMSGYLNMTGPEGGPPLKPSAPLLSWRHACNHALVGLLLAIRHRRLTGQATHVDVAARDTGLWMLTHTYQYWDMEQINLHRKGASRDVGKPGPGIPSVYPCRDGRIVWMLLGGRLAQGSIDKLVDWMAADGYAPPWLQEVDWATLDLRELPDITAFMAPFAAFFLTKMKAELLERAIKDGFMLAPALSVDELLDDPQLAARGSWSEVEIAGRRVRVATAPTRFNEIEWQPRDAMAK